MEMVMAIQKAQQALEVLPDPLALLHRLIAEDLYV
jgi:hypothetical protein